MRVPPHVQLDRRQVRRRLLRFRNPLAPLAKELHRVVRPAVPVREHQGVSGGVLGRDGGDAVTPHSELSYELRVDVDVPRPSVFRRSEFSYKGRSRREVHVAPSQTQVLKSSQYF
ncbi:hypothetical protein [Rathayibacter rathayi]|uniref:hypothetical protein n=1 Tax=Rathayibacter rathayi TaxID=33887 RepID=UPI0015E24294|nr:hypothetical protein [Rathayibacter rathayi]